MMDYSKLVIALREHSKRNNCNCDTCFAYDAETRGYITCSEELTEKAADAIEELQAAVEREKTYTQFCPLVPVPPHGRLIDAYALRTDWLENGENEYVYDTNAFLDSIDSAPTIIPADKEGEG